MFVALVLIFIVAPIVELYVIIQVAQVIGGWETIALLIVESIVGAWLMKRQGATVLRRIQAQLEEHRLPGKELVDGALILFAGALMLTPGFLTDILGFVLLIPPSRAVVRKILMASFLTKRLGKGFVVLRTGAGIVGFDGFGRSSGDAGGVYDTTGREQPRHPGLP